MSLPVALGALVLVLATAGAEVAGPLAGLLARGDAAWAERARPERLGAALEAYRRAAALDAVSVPAQLRLARAEAFRALQEPASAAEAWPEASRAAERALRVSSPAWAAEVDAGRSPAGAAGRVEAPGAEALYWLALSTWAGAQLKGFAALLAVKDVALASMERAAALDERIDCGGPHRALGAWRAALPAAVGGGAAAARAHFTRARQLGPACQLTRVREAQTLLVLLQDRKGFEAALGEVIAFDASRAPEWEPENLAAQREARELLARRDRLLGP